MLFQIHVQRRTASQVLDVFLAVQTEFVQDIGVRVFHDVKIAVVTVAVDFITVFLVPFGVFHAYVFGRNHFAIEHQFL